MYSIDFSTFDELRAEMVAFHKSREAIARAADAAASTQRASHFERGVALTHNSMVSFWEDLKIVESKSSEAPAPILQAR